MLCIAKETLNLRSGVSTRHVRSVRIQSYLFYKRTPLWDRPLSNTEVLPCSSVIGDHKTDDDDRHGSENVTKATTLRARITVSQPAFLALSSLRDYDVKLPNFTFYGGRKHSSWTCIRRLVRNSTPGEFAYTLQNKWVGIIAMKIEKTRIQFLSNALAAAAVLASSVPY